MTKPFKGKIELDIRDSTPDWEPYLAPKAPEGAPERAVPRVGRPRLRARWTCSAGRSRRRTCAASPTRGVKFANFHTTALCSPTRASLLTGRNATTQRHGDRSPSSRSGFPGHLDAHPVRERLHLRGARRARVQHLLRRQVAPDAGRGVQPRRVQGPVAARPRASSASTAGSAARRTTGIPDLVHDNHQIDPPGRPEDGYHLAEDLSDKAIEFIRDAKVDRSRQAVLHVPRAAGRPRARTTCRRSGPTSTRASSTRATRRSAPRSWPARSSSGCCPKAPSSRRSTRTASPSAPAPTGSPGRCSTPCGRGTR